MLIHTNSEEMELGGPQLFMLTTCCIDPDHGCRVFRVPELMGMNSEGVMVVHPVMQGPGQNWTWINQEAKLARQNLMERIMDPRLRRRAWQDHAPALGPDKRVQHAAHAVLFHQHPHVLWAEPWHQGSARYP